MLKIGDKIRITSIPGEGVQGYYLHPSTKKVFQKLIKRDRPVRISRIDANGQPWYECRFKKPDGTFECHSLMVASGETNWELVNG